ncbi:hypothetical protein GCM10027610_056270 [Dactylosporangium cerinum]
MLAAEQSVLSTQFARSGTDKWAGVTWEPSPTHGNPVLTDVLAWIECEFDCEYDAGDHIIVVAKVRDLGSRAGTGPLLYFKSAYAELASTP